ncbi:MAG: non-reducing end alpha-L-arabinofuranosidase family hydrolase [Armatimonadota bacterium]
MAFDCKTLLPFALPLLALVALAAGAASEGKSEAGGPRSRRADLLAGDFRWMASPPLVAPVESADDAYYSVKDPSVVFYGGKWHLFCTVRGEKRSHQIEYLSFAHWAAAHSAERTMLTMHDGFFCAPQVFYFAPHEKWYLICQASDDAWEPKYGAAYSTSRNIADPTSWTPLRPLQARQADGKSGLDFWVICDETKAHLFFTTLDGRMWREETPLADFPTGWSEPALAIQADIFEASHIYSLQAEDKYLALIEAQGGHGWRYFKAYIADRLDAEWRPLAATRDKAFASMANVRFAGERWTDCISHGELLRAGVDQRLEVDPTDLRFVFQGALDRDRAGKKYGEIPWRLGMLKPAP